MQGKIEDPGPCASAVEAAIAGRRSIRAFKPDPVAREVVEHLLDLAGRAPSGTNMQPWRAYVLAGRAKPPSPKRWSTVIRAGIRLLKR